MMKYYYVPFVRPGSSCNRGSVIAFGLPSVMALYAFQSFLKTEAITKPLT